MREETTLGTRSLIRQTIYFVLICIGASFLIDLVTYLSVGPFEEAQQMWGVVLRLRMLVPALTATCLLMILSPEKVSLHGRVFFIAFLSTVAVPLVLIGLGYRTAGSVVQRVLTVLLTGFITALHARPAWQSALEPLGLGFERNSLLFLLILVLYVALLVVSFALNPGLGLSKMPPDGSLRDLVLSFPTMLVMVPVIGWVSYFGEEYGWRYYLQERLCALFGPRRGVLVVGVMWGLWHAPIIAMGYNYPGRPFLGIAAMALFTIVIGVYFSYAVMRTGSIWSAVILHGMTNTLAPQLIRYFGQAKDSVLSFGLGLYGIALFALPALVLFAALPEVYRRQRVEVEEGPSVDHLDHSMKAKDSEVWA